MTTPHIKRFGEWSREQFNTDFPNDMQEAVTVRLMLDDIAEHVERLERNQRLNDWFELKGYSHIEFTVDGKVVGTWDGNTWTDTTSPVRGNQD